MYGRKVTHSALSDWTQAHFSLTKTPGRAIMSRIFNDPSLEGTEYTTHNSLRCTTPRNIELDKAPYAWIGDMGHKMCCISSLLIQGKARILASLVNEQLADKKGLVSTFHMGGSPGSSIVGHFNHFVFMKKVGTWMMLQYIWSSRFFRRKSCSTISRMSSTVMSRECSGKWHRTEQLLVVLFLVEKCKPRYTFLWCCNSDGSEKIPLLFIGNAASPRCFKKKTPDALGLIYKSNKKAWMKSDLFYDWLL